MDDITATVQASISSDGGAGGAFAASTGAGISPDGAWAKSVMTWDD